MATINSAGVGSGLDVNSIVTQLMAIERKPIDLLQKVQTKLQTQLSSMGQLQSSLSTLRDAAQALTRPSTWSAATATVADESILSASTSAAAVPGHYGVTVSSLASSQTLVSRGYAASTSTVGSGTLTIELGTWGANQGSFTAKTGTTPVAVTVAATATLADVRDAINASGSGVVASIVNDANGSRLAIRSRDTGAENAFRITATDDDGNDADAAGLSELAYDPSAGVTTMTRKQSSVNAKASINGVDVESASNTLTEVIDGLTINLNSVSATPVDIAVNADKESIRKAVTDFATAYNDLMTQGRKLTSYDASSKSAGALQGDSAVVALQQQLRQIAGGTSAASTLYTRLADIGLDPQRDGTLKINDDKLDSALDHMDELRKVLGNGDVLNKSNDGLAMALRRYADGALGIDGVMTTHKQGLTDRIDRNSDQQARLEDRMSDIEKRMRAQYTALDAQMAKLNSLSDYVTQQVKILSNSNNSG